MAKTPPSAGRPGRQLLVLALVSVILFALTFFSGTAGMSWTERLMPRLGMDLVGGTRVTLLAATEDGQAPSGDALEVAREIIESRVNALGVEEAEVVTEGGNQIVVSVAGEPENALRSVVTRPSYGSARCWTRTWWAPPTGRRTTAPVRTVRRAPTTSRTAEDAEEAEPAEEAERTPAAPADRPTTRPTATRRGPGSGARSRSGARRSGRRSATTMAAALAIVDGRWPTHRGHRRVAGGGPAVRRADRPRVAVLPAKLQFYLPTITCAQLNARPAGSIADPDELAVACDEEGITKYLLDTSKVLGTDIAGADAVLPAGTARWEIALRFTSDGQPKWTDLTREALNNHQATPFDVTQLAMDVVIDEETGELRFDTSPEAAEQANRYQRTWVAAVARRRRQPGQLPGGGGVDNRDLRSEIQAVITGDARIHGDFTAAEAQVLASQLQSGAPLTFDRRRADHQRHPRGGVPAGRSAGRRDRDGPGRAVRVLHYRLLEW